MSKNSRNFYSIDLGRSRTPSGLASDLAERILATLNESSSITGETLAEAIGADPVEVQDLVHAMVNLKLIQRSAQMNLALSASGKIALESKLLSVSSSNSVE